jgi:hypothetical protein
VVALCATAGRGDRDLAAAVEAMRQRGAAEAAARDLEAAITARVVVSASSAAGRSDGSREALDRPYVCVACGAHMRLPAVCLVCLGTELEPRRDDAPRVTSPVG